jgi:hypothetical protein
MPAKKVKSQTDRRLDRLEQAMKYFSDGLWRISNEVALNRPGRHNPQREELERRVLELENKFFAFQCGAQAQMEQDRKAAFEVRDGEANERIQAVREALGAKQPN